jgi:hypothetical protein
MPWNTKSANRIFSAYRSDDTLQKRHSCLQESKCCSALTSRAFPFGKPQSVMSCGRMQQCHPLRECPSGRTQSLRIRLSAPLKTCPCTGLRVKYTAPSHATSGRKHTLKDARGAKRRNQKKKKKRRLAIMMRVSCEKSLYMRTGMLW